MAVAVIVFDPTLSGTDGAAKTLVWTCATTPLTVTPTSSAEVATVPLTIVLARLTVPRGVVIAMSKQFAVHSTLTVKVLPGLLATRTANRLSPGGTVIARTIRPTC